MCPVPSAQYREPSTEKNSSQYPAPSKRYPVTVPSTYGRLRSLGSSITWLLKKKYFFCQAKKGTLFLKLSRSDSPREAPRVQEAPESLARLSIGWLENSFVRVHSGILGNPMKYEEFLGNH